MINKYSLFENLLNTAQQLLQNAKNSRDESQESANEHIGAMESRYDTFKEEAQYLAGAYSRMTAEFEDSVSKIKKILNTKDLFCEKPNKVGIASLVTVSDSDENTHIYLMSPAMGGETINVDGCEIKVITPTAPIGKALMGKEIDESIVLSISGKKNELFVDDIQ